jgi:hypothetical protein
MSEDDWPAVLEEQRRREVERLRRAHDRWKGAALILAGLLAIVCLFFIVYSAEQQRRLDEAWSLLRVPGAEEPDVSLGRFGQVKLGMTVEEVEHIFGFRRSGGEGGEGEVHYSWRLNGNYAGFSFGMEDGQVKAGSFISAGGKQYWLERER